MTVEFEPCGIERPGKPRTLGMKVTNTSAEAIPFVTVMVQWENEQPQPSGSNINTHGGGTMLKALGIFHGTLGPRQSQVFYVDEKYVRDELLGRVAALSTERYWIAALSGDREIGRYRGGLIASVLEGLGL